MAWTRTGRRLEELEQDVKELRELHEELKELPIECEMYFEKFRNLLSRLGQRERDQAKQENGVAGHIGAPRTINPLARKLLGLKEE